MISTALATLVAVAVHDLLDVGLRGLLGRRRVHPAAQARPLRRVTAQVAIQVVVVAVVGMMCVVLAGPAGLLPGGVAAAVLVGWAWTHAWWPPAGALLTALLGALVVWDLATGRIGEGSGLPVMAVGAVVVLFLMQSANRITRSVLSLAGRGDAVPVPATSPASGPGGSDEELELKGGRFIGPMERILVLGLALAGAEGIIGALMAAKGIVRFPEISADRQRGGRAEEFLVGSLTSWGLAAGGVLLLWLWQNSS